MKASFSICLLSCQEITMPVIQRYALLALLLVFIENERSIIHAHAFCVTKPLKSPRHPVWLAARYGPMDADKDDPSAATISASSEGTTPSNELSHDKKEAFRNLVDSVLQVQDPQHVPSLLTKNIELVLLFTTEAGAELVEAVLEDKLTEHPDAETATATLEAIDIIVTFAEEFVQHTASIEQHNRELLGKILKVMSAAEQGESANIYKTTQEDALDALMQREKQHFTPGFLRHIDMECSRIAGAPTMTRESARLLETLRMIQARVLEELGADLGEAAQVLGQLIAYDSASERVAVLEAGLTVRGCAFAQELLQLTTEALDGFQKVIGGADPDLVSRVRQIDDRLRQYLDEEANDNDGAVVGFE
jgi:hypothetical protein